MIHNKIVIWKKDDGTIITTTFITSNIPKGISEEEFVSTQITRLQKDTCFGNKQYFLIDKTQFSSFMASIPEEQHDRVKINNFGVLYVDNNFKTKKDKMIDAKNSIKEKLTSGTPLTDEEASYLLKI